jgi:hypothetical protein
MLAGLALLGGFSVWTTRDIPQICEVGLGAVKNGLPRCFNENFAAYLTALPPNPTAPGPS